MRKVILFFSLFFILPLVSQASVFYNDDLNALTTGIITTGLTGEFGDFIVYSGVSNIIDTNCYDGNCIEVVSTARVAYDTQIGIQNLLGTYSDNYFSFLINIPENDIDIDVSTTLWFNVITRKFGGGTNAHYIHFCKTTEQTYSMVLSAYPQAINNCDNVNYGARVGTGTFGQWERVTIHLDTVEQNIGAKLNDSAYSRADSDGYDIIRGIIFTGTYDGENNIYLDNLSISSYDPTSFFQLDYTLSAVDEDWTQEDIGCDVDAKAYCAIATSTYAMAIQGEATSTIDNWKYEYLMTEADFSPIEPQSAYNKTYFYTLAGSIITTDAIIFPDKNKSIYLLQVCLAPSDEFPLILGGVHSLCKNQYIGNGYESDELRGVLISLGLISSSTNSVIDNPSAITLWGELDCDNIGITDIKKGLQCALIWAFDPPQSSIARFNTLKDNILSLYPIGYATLVISDFNDAIGTTTTEYFDSEIPIGELFGQEGGTTTIDFDNMLEYKDIGAPVFDWVEFIMWFGFVIWLIMWGTSRTL